MSDRKPERRGLGRGLSALMADINLDASNPSQQTADRSRDQRVPVENLIPNPDQPRRDFEVQALDELAASIREKGVIQPLIVRPSPNVAGKFEIVAGERRWRAAQLAQLHDVPVVIRTLSDTEVLEVAIIENIQRADLNAVEEAMGYRQLVDRFGHTQEKLAEAMGKSRSHIANLMRLLTLPEDVLGFLRQGKLSAGHARALITTDNASELARRVIAEDLTVRETEALVKRPPSASAPRPSQSRGKPVKDADTRMLEQDLSANLGMAVVIDHLAGGEGQMTIRYQSLDQLDQLCQALSTGG
jgi:ParB family chromosome partitioning protein